MDLAASQHWWSLQSTWALEQLGAHPLPERGKSKFLTLDALELH